MKNSEIVAITNAYQELDADTKLPISAAWARRLNMKALMEARQTINEAVKDINKDYITPDRSIDEGDGMYQIRPEYLAEYQSRMAELMEQETDVVIKKVNIAELGEVSVSDREMDALAFMIEEA